MPRRLAHFSDPRLDAQVGELIKKHKELQDMVKQQEKQLRQTLSSLGLPPHEHSVTDITDFPSEMTPIAHDHEVGDIVDFPEAMTPTEHSHEVADITDFPVDMAPSGVIVMWSGAVNTIPQGWALCNGANGTPDLRDRFIVGAGSKYAVGNKGGADSVTLTVNQIPAHTHTIGSFQKMDWGTYNNTDQLTPGTSSKSASTGGGQAHENRPPYYALCFIMKL